jgi:type II pantothenate kinase
MFFVLYRREDMALSLLSMISNNIGQIAYLTAINYGLKRIFFGGFFIRGNPVTMAKMSFAINFWSKGTMKVCASLFLLRIERIQQMKTRRE